MSQDINCLAIDSQVCIHGRLFANPVKLSWCITGPVGPLGSTNQNWLCAKLLPMAVSIYSVVCVHSCCLLGTQHCCLWSNGRGAHFWLARPGLMAGGPTFGLPARSHRPHPLSPAHPLIRVIRDITGVVKNYLKNHQ